MNDHVIMSNFKKIIIDNDYIMLSKFIEFIKNDNYIKELLIESKINNMNIYQYIVSNSYIKMLDVFLENGFDINYHECDDDLYLLEIAIKNKDLITIKKLCNINSIQVEFIKNKYKSNIYIELAKINEIQLIKWLIKNNKWINILNHEDEKGNNILFYINNNHLLKELIKLDNKLLNSINDKNNNFLLECCESNNKELVKFIIQNFQIKLNILNNNDRNLLHYLLINKWFDLLDELKLKSIKKEYLIFDIYSKDPFIYLLNSNDSKYINKYYNLFKNKNCIEHYINILIKEDNNSILLFFEKEKNKLSENLIFNTILGLLESKKFNECQTILNSYEFKNKYFYELIFYVVEKYCEGFK